MSFPFSATTTMIMASSAATALQVVAGIGQAINKLHKLWCMVKDVPHEIIDLMNQIDCLYPTLIELEYDLSPENTHTIPPNAFLLRRTITYCRKALYDLDSLTQELSGAVYSTRYRKKLACLKVILKKELLQSLKKRLDCAVKVLILVQQTYLIALTRAQPDLIIRKWAQFAEQNAATNQRPNSNLESNIKSLSPVKDQQGLHHGGCSSQSTIFWQKLFGFIKFRNSHKGYRVSVDIPSWLSNISWELHGSWTMGSWTYTLQSYTRRPWESQVFQIAQYGSSLELKRMFADGIASPYDKDTNGATLIHMAARGYNVDTFQFLTSLPLTSLETDDSGLYPLVETLQYEENSTRVEEFIRALVSNNELLSEYVFASNIDEKLIRKYLGWHSREVSSESLEARITKTIRGLWSSNWWFKSILGLSLNDEMCNLRRPSPALSTIATAMPSITTSIGTSCPHTRQQCVTCSESWSSWLSYAKETIYQPASTHASRKFWGCCSYDKSKCSSSLLRIVMVLLFKNSEPKTKKWWEDHFLGGVRGWLGSLQQEGVDLVEFGESQLAMFRENEFSHDVTSVLS
ncbi:hypothetical protein F5Y16DRAFT_345603 [Xylariaceae sp. FL0255]|nr:hypothetical protein F5Y16DRAFT_345603 [Xylariaceae sp. FL0255]